MPRQDGTGPIGSGPMTGRGLGRCKDINADNYSLGFRRRFERGVGLGRCFERGYDWSKTPIKSEKDLLAEEREFLKNRLDIIDKQLENL